VIAADAGADCDVPAILLTRCPVTHALRLAEFPGESSLRQLAEALAQVHRVGVTAVGYRLYFDRGAAAPTPLDADLQRSENYASTLLAART